LAKVTLEQWRMLRAVVEHGGFAQAASAIHKSPSSINHAIHKMESLLGVPLLEVKGRKAHLTGAGSVLLRRAERILESVQNLEALADNLSVGLETEVVIAIDQAFPERILSQVLTAFSQRYPVTRVELHETVLSGTEELISDGKADLGITPCSLSGRLGEFLMNIDFIAVARPDHPLHHLTVLTESDLEPYRQIVVRDSSSKHSINVGWLGAQERWTASNLHTSVAWVVQGLGYAWLPLSAISTYLENGSLKPLPLLVGAKRSMDFQLYHADIDKTGEATQYLAELIIKGCDQKSTLLLPKL
jgi:molybdate transport repressor ModE-like protein